MQLPTTVSPPDGTSHRGANTAAASVRLLLLEGFQLETDVGPVDVPVTAQRLLAFLALHQRPLRRAYVAYSLWPDSSDERAAGSLRSALWRLNRPGLEFVQPGASHLQLGPSVEVDVTGLITLALRLSAGEPVDAACTVAGGFEHDLLPDWYDDWVVAWRERWRLLRLLALESLVGLLSDAGAYGAAVDTGLAAVRAEPLRESTHRAIIKAHMAEGNHHEALRQYDEYRRLLDRELGLAPSAVMERVIAGLTRR